MSPTVAICSQTDPGPQRVQGAARTGHHLVRDGPVGEHRQHDVGAARGVRRGAGGPGAGVGEGVGVLRGVIPDRHGEAGADQVAGHRRAHPPGSEHRDVGSRGAHSGIISGCGPDIATEPAMMRSIRSRSASLRLSSAAATLSSMCRGLPGADDRDLDGGVGQGPGDREPADGDSELIGGEAPRARERPRGSGGRRRP